MQGTFLLWRMRGHFYCGMTHFLNLLDSAAIRAMKSAAVGLLFCSSFLWAGPAVEPSETLVITNVNVVDTRYGGIEPNVNVIVKDGIITAISKFALVNAGPHDHVIN